MVLGGEKQNKKIKRVFAKVCMSCLFILLVRAEENCNPYTEEHRTFLAQGKEYSDYWTLWQQQYNETKLKLSPCTSQQEYISTLSISPITWCCLFLLCPGQRHWVLWVILASLLFRGKKEKEKKKKGKTVQIKKQDLVSTCNSITNAVI